MNPNLISHLDNHDLKPQREFGGFFNRTPIPTSSGYFSANSMLKKDQAGKIKGLKPHEVLFCTVCQF
jgi:hypothetical protein